MPNGILGGLGDFFNALSAGAGGPAGQEMAFRRQGYNSLAQQMGPGDAALAMSNPQLYEAMWRQRLFQAQMDDYARQHPGAGFNQGVYGTSPEGQKQEFGPPPVVPGFKFGPYEAPGLMQHGPSGWQLQPPPGFSNNPAPVGQAAASQNAGGTNLPQATPGQGGSGGLPPVVNDVLEYERQLASNKALGTGQGEKAVDVGAAVDEVDRSIKLIDELAVHPGMKWATGIFANIPGGPPKGTEAYGFTKGVSQLKDKLTLDLMPTLQKMRTSPAVLEFIQHATGGQELDLGSPNFAKNLQDTRAALVQIRSAIQRGANAPITEAPKVEGGLPTFNTQSELRAAIKAKKLNVGDSFKTGDGRTLIAQ